jgi:crotonobetainyl-CoA:carnitine CoA-transferase CaiB-like acyl-CoA transferase
VIPPAASTAAGLVASTAASGPLSGLAVIEIGRYIAAPFAGRQLAALGADVLKVEEPGTGDPMRHWEGGTRPYSPQFSAYNLGKRSIELDLRAEDGKTALRDLAGTADVLIENFRPGVMDRLNLGPAALTTANPRLIYCSITGFGPSGPLANQPSYDTVISAISGMYSLLMPLSDPAPVGPALSDLLAGMFAAQGILAALHHREKAGTGQVVDVTMLGAVLSFLGEAVTSTAETGQPPEPDTRQRRAQAYGATGADGLAFVVHLSVPDKFWRGLCAAMDSPGWLDDPRFASRQGRYDHYSDLDELIKARARTRPRADWFAAFAARDLPHAPLNTLAGIAQDPQVKAMGLVERIPVPGGEPMAVTTSPIRFSATPAGQPGPAPLLGQA